MAGTRVIPHSKESECLALGAALNSIDALNEVCETLEEGDFYLPQHKAIFRAIHRLQKTNKQCDVYLAAEELKRQKALSDAGGVPYLVELSQHAGTSTYAEAYARVVKEKATLRALYYTGAQIAEQSLGEGEFDVVSFLDECQQKLFRLSADAATAEASPIKDIFDGSTAAGATIEEQLAAAQQLYKEMGPAGALRGKAVSTGYRDVDTFIHGFGNSNLVILAGRPSMGKTAFALNCALNAAREHKSVGFFSLEMDKDQLARRLLSIHSEVGAKQIAEGNISADEMACLHRAAEELRQIAIIIDDLPGITLAQLRSRARRMVEAHNINLLFIDYLQLIEPPARRAENRQVEVSEISRGLKRLARDLNIPVVALAQLSRRVEERQGHRPMMSDLRESGSLEQDSDVVMMMFRRDYYDPMDKPGKVEIIVCKNRHGATGSAHLAFEKEKGKILQVEMKEQLEWANRADLQ